MGFKNLKRKLIKVNLISTFETIIVVKVPIDTLRTLIKKI